MIGALFTTDVSFISIASTQKQLAEFQRYLKLEKAQWLPQRAAAYRYLALVDPDKRRRLEPSSYKPRPNPPRKLRADS
jgi:hypothetical protein